MFARGHRHGSRGRWIRRRWAPYLVAHFGKSLLWHGSLWLFAFFLTETCGVPPRVMGLVICASLCANALADLAIARWVRPRGVSWPVVARLQRRGAMLAGLFFLLFSLTPFVPMAVRTPFALAALLGFRITFAMLDVPQNAMIALLASSAQARAKVLAARNVAAGLASLLVGGVAAPLLLSRVDGAWGHLVWAGGVTAIMGWSAYALSRSSAPDGGRVAPSVRPLGQPPHPLPLWLLPLTAMIVVASTLFRSMEPYAVAYADMGAPLLWWSAVGSIICQPVWAGMLRRLPRAIPPLLAALAGVVPIVILGNGASLPAIGVAVIGLGFGIASGGIWLMLWSAALGGAAARDAAARVARLTAVSKVAQGVAALYLGEVLHGTAYRHALADPASSPRMTMIGALAVIVLCGIALAAAQRRVSRTAGGAGSAMQPPAATPAPVRAAPPPAPYRAHQDRVAAAG